MPMEDSKNVRATVQLSVKEEGAEGNWEWILWILLDS